eukprot:scaffold2586_cov190-Pinguiococcus_pyrenoidosus.AAC.2
MLSGAASLCFHQSADFWLHLGGSSTNIAPAAIVDPERLVRADRGQESAHGIPDDALHEVVVLVQLRNQAAEDVSAPAGDMPHLSSESPPHQPPPDALPCCSTRCRRSPHHDLEAASSAAPFPRSAWSTPVGASSGPAALRRTLRKPPGHAA